MFLQNVRQTNCALRVMSEDLLDEVHIDAPAIAEISFGGVVKIDRVRNGKEANTPGAWVFPGLGAKASKKEASLKKQPGPDRGRRRLLGKPYAPVVLPRPKLEVKPASKRQVPSTDEQESEDETGDEDETSTSRTLDAPSSGSSVVVPSKKKKTNKRRIDSEDDGGMHRIPKLNRQ